MKRDFYFDNAKFILMFFVVFGHLLQSYIDTDVFISYIYRLIYTFHMPAFILVSGYFAKGIYEKGYTRHITRKLIVPYIIFQLIYSVFYYFLYSKEAFNVDFLNPHWSLWFLISLFCWNLMLIIFNKMKPSHALICAVILGLAVGYADWISNFLSLSRTFVFFPFFLIGYYLNKNHLQTLRTLNGKLIAAATIFIIAIGMVYFPELNVKWLLGSKPYNQLESIAAFGMLKRIGLYSVNLLMVGSFFALVPRRRFFFTNWGKNTLYVYLLHGFIVRIFRESELEKYINNNKTMIILIIITFVLISLLSSKFIIGAAQPIIEIKGSKWRTAIHDFKMAMQTLKRKMLSE